MTKYNFTKILSISLICGLISTSSYAGFFNLSRFFQNNQAIGYSNHMNSMVGSSFPSQQNSSFTSINNLNQNISSSFTRSPSSNYIRTQVITQTGQNNLTANYRRGVSDQNSTLKSYQSRENEQKSYISSNQK